MTFHWIDPASVYWDDWLLLFVQTAGLVALIVYVWKTWQMASATRLAAEATREMAMEARDARLEALAPRIVVYFDASKDLGAEVVIHNAGAGAAGDVKVTFSPPLQTTQEKDPFLAFFDLPQSVVPPNYTIRHTFDGWPKYFESDLPREYAVTAEYKGLENGREYRTTFVLNIEALRWKLVHQDPWRPAEVFSLAKEAVRNLGRLAEETSSDSAVKRYIGALSLTGQSSVALLTDFWLSLSDAKTTDSYIPDWNEVVQVLRVLSLAALSETRHGPYTDAQRDALLKVVRLLHRFDAVSFGNSKWQQDTKAAFTEFSESTIKKK